MRDRYEIVATKNMKWKNYNPAVAEAMQEMGIDSIGLLYEQITDFLGSDCESKDFKSQISYASLRQTLIGQNNPYSEDQDEQIKYTPSALAIAAFFKKSVEDLFGEIPEEDVRIQVGGRIKKIPREEAIVPLRDHFGNYSGADQMLKEKEFIASMERALGSLKPKEKSTIEFLFGFGGDIMQHPCIANELGVTPNRISQIKKRAIEKLKHPSVSRHLRPYYYENPEIL